MKSEFRGGNLIYILFNILIVLSATFTVGLLTPLVLVSYYQWEVENTYIDGKKLIFKGTAAGLYKNWIIWILLCIITLGIYYFWLNIRLLQWKTKHTHFDI